MILIGARECLKKICAGQDLQWRIESTCTEPQFAETVFLMAEYSVCETKRFLMEGAFRELSKISQLSSHQIEALRQHDQATVEQLDQQLEPALGAKEWAMRALNEHRREHGC